MKLYIKCLVIKKRRTNKLKKNKIANYSIVWNKNHETQWNKFFSYANKQQKQNDNDNRIRIYKHYFYFKWFIYVIVVNIVGS